MYTAEITFRRRGRGDKQEEEAAVHSYVLALRSNGQILDRDFAIVAIRGGYQTSVGLPEDTALRSSRTSKHVREKLRELKRTGITVTKTRVLGEDTDSDFVCTCRKIPSLILETNLLSAESPLNCGECFGRVPLYRIPHTNVGTCEGVLYWAWLYRALDSLWIGSGVGEQFAYRQLSQHDSDFSKEGREICRGIEKRSGIPVYYYLQRYYARSMASERRRPCPSCGKKWLLEEPWHNRYDFRCDRCRLVSNIGCDVRGS